MLICADLFDSSLLVVYLLVCAALGVAYVVAMVARLFVIIRYHGSNHTKAECNLTGQETARKMLDSLALSNVQVKKASFWRATFWGNSYSARQKTIFLRRGIVDNNSVTAVAMACQKVALAVMDRDGNKKLKVREKLAPLTLLAPVLFVPIMLIGIIVDVIVFQSGIGIVSIISIIIGLVLTILGLVVTLLTLPVEKEAIHNGMEIIKKTAILNDSETIKAQKMFNAYIIGYVADFVITVLAIIKFILKLIMQFSKED